ncbi:MAG TPA: hypothetical protein VM684_06215 [Gaiellales bacterium]|nr:hypothetical protein [Gaiellales bacterium]
MGRRFKALIGVGAVTLALVSASLAWAAVAGPPTKVLGGRGSQMLPAATPGGSFLSWTLIRSGQVDAFLRPAGQPKIQLNRRGLGWNGNISGTEAIYQQVVRNRSNIYIYDTGTQTRHAPPGVNTSAWEFYPRIDVNHVLFGRSGRNHSWRVLLADTSGPSTTLLEKHTGRPVRQLLPGGVAGDWATWARYSPRTHHGTVVLYQISTHHAGPLAVPRGKAQYASTVDHVGDLFYVRSNIASCGRGVVIREAINGGSDVRLARIPRGYDIGVMNAVDEGPGDGVTVYFDRVNCNSGFYDSYKIVVS